MHRHTAPTLAILLTVVVMAGCTNDEAGDPTPVDTTTSTTDDEPPSNSVDEEELPSDGAPAVTDPLDTDAFEQDPCRMLTDAQVEQAGLIPPGESGEGATAASCAWRNRTTNSSARVQFEVESRRGLSAAYRANADGEYDLWDEVPDIAGYPAVIADITDGRASGDCAIVVGTSDEVTLDLAVTLSASKVGEVDPCDAAQEVAELALQTMKNS